MRTEVSFVPGFEFIIDPNRKYEQIDAREILSSLGYLPEWLYEGLSIGQGMEESLTTRYVYYSGPTSTDDFKIEMDGSYEFPGDPISQPLARVKGEDETLYFYQHAFVAVIGKDGSTWFTRMD